MRNEGCLIDVGRHDHANHGLAPSLIGLADHRRSGHGRVAAQRVLDLAGGHVLAARDDDVLLPIDDVEHPVLVESADIAGVQPSVDDRLGRQVGPVPVAGHHLRAADENLPIGRDANLVLARRQPGRAEQVRGLRRRLAMSVGVQVHGVAGQLGHPVPLRQTDLRLGQHTLQHRQRHRGCPVADDLGRAERVGGPTIVIEQHGEHGRSERHLGDAVLGARVEHGLGFKPREQNDGAAGVVHHDHVVRRHMEQREREQVDVVPPDRSGIPAGRARREQSAVREHRPLR